MYKKIVESDLYEEYIELLINRVTHSTMSLEKDLGNPDDSKNAIKLRDNMRAFKYLLNNIDTNCMTEDLIINVANLINDSSEYISNGYRNSGEYITETDIPISSPENIKYDLLNLLKKYYNEWRDIDPFEREAMFHIEFIRIHPFEDGNGRTGRLLLNFNLLKQGIAPVIITTDLEEYYNSYIYDNDINGMANIFRIQSKREELVFNQLLENYEENTLKNQK